MLGLGPEPTSKSSWAASRLKNVDCNQKDLLSAAIPKATVERLPKTAAPAATRRQGPFRLICFEQRSLAGRYWPFRSNFTRVPPFANRALENVIRSPGMLCLIVGEV